eukprot:gnl/Dysnectes_brevis/5103_a7198_339.p1 GENE.gnl/Dysnectes_brevis/5103_a7198_339~~gnl/Dysnectes_brevis/5103_a7198_339.p1  ORF type:complete len:838 (-),score=140.05 gnl/Dysnectes_brevis/5103_a7198_339:78-2558(-)
MSRKKKSLAQELRLLSNEINVCIKTGTDEKKLSSSFSSFCSLAIKSIADSPDVQSEVVHLFKSHPTIIHQIPTLSHSTLHYLIEILLSICNTIPSDLASEAMSILGALLSDVPRMQKAFVPSPSVLLKLALPAYLTTDRHKAYRHKAVDFCLFLLEVYPLDLTDLSDDQRVIQLLTWADRRRLHAVIQGLRTGMAQAQQTIKEHTAQIGVLEAEVAQRGAVIAEHADNLQKATKVLSRHNGELRSVLRFAVKAEGRLQSTAESIESVRQEHFSLTSRLDGIEEQRGEALASQKELEQRVSSIATEAQRSSENIRAEASALQCRIEDEARTRSVEQHKETTKAVETMEARASAISGRLDALENRVRQGAAGTADEFVQLSRSLGDLGHRAKLLEDSAAAVRARIKSCEEQLQRAQVDQTSLSVLEPKCRAAKHDSSALRIPAITATATDSTPPIARPGSSEADMESKSPPVVIVQSTPDWKEIEEAGRQSLSPPAKSVLSPHRPPKSAPTTTIQEPQPDPEVTKRVETLIWLARNCEWSCPDLVLRSLHEFFSWAYGADPQLLARLPTRVQRAQQTAARHAITCASDLFWRRAREAKGTPVTGTSLSPWLMVTDPDHAKRVIAMLRIIEGLMMFPHVLGVVREPGLEFGERMVNMIRRSRTRGSLPRLRLPAPELDGSLTASLLSAAVQACRFGPASEQFCSADGCEALAQVLGELDAAAGLGGEVASATAALSDQLAVHVACGLPLCQSGLLVALCGLLDVGRDPQMVGDVLSCLSRLLSHSSSDMRLKTAVMHANVSLSVRRLTKDDTFGREAVRLACSLEGLKM